MAEAKKTYDKSWKETYREKVGAIRDWILKPKNLSVIWPIICFFFVAILAILVARLWCYNLTFPGRCLNIDDLFKEGIESSLWVNICMMVGCVVATIFLIIYGYFIKPAWWHLVVYTIIATYICVIPQWQPIEAPIHGIYYSELIAFSLFLAFVCELCAMILERVTQKNLIPLASGEHGFVIKTEDSKMVDTRWDDYIKTIFELIGTCQLKNESFAIGIAGSWGSGKTTFYEAIKRKIQEDKKYLLCEFKPWQILETGLLAPEFFTIFANTLKEGKNDQNTQVRKDIIKYAKLLTEVPKISEYAKIFTSVLNIEEGDTISSMRDRIDQQLSNSNTHIIVLIDDLDRLNKEELLEIMRLVRASANFKHVLFILTYDKGYFEKILDDEQGLEYLKKIVNIEISLPPIEQYKYGQLLYQSIANICSDAFDSIEKNKKAEKILSDLDKLIKEENARVEESVLYKYLHNFRDIKRFANLLGLALRHLIVNDEIHTLNFIDLFWLEVLHYVDEDTYDILRTNHNTLLEFRPSRLIKQRTLTLRENPDITTKKSYSILLKLFAKTDNYKPLNSIVRISNYYSFFTYRLVEHYVSTTEFTILINTLNQDRLVEKVKRWLKESYNRNGVEQILKDYPLNGRFENEKVANNYTYILTSLLFMNKPCNMEEFVLEQVKEKYHRKYFIKIPSYNPEALIKELITEHPSPLWNIYLTTMCSSVDKALYEEDEESIRHYNSEIAYVLTIKQLQELAILNYTQLYKGKRMTVWDLFNRKKEQMKFVMSLNYPIRTTILNKQVTTYDNLIGDYILQQFSIGPRRKKFKIETFLNIYKNLIEFSKAKGIDDEERAVALVQNTLEQAFGPIAKFESFIKNNFDLDDTCLTLCKQIGLNI